MEVYKNNEWAREPRFQSFWAHYAVVQRWIVKNREMVATTSNPQFVIPEIPRTLKRERTRRAGRRVQAKRERKAALQYGANSFPESSSCTGMNGTDLVETYETAKNASSDFIPKLTEEDLEMDEEMKAFFAKTIEHKKQREALREEQRRKEAGVRSDHWILINDEEYVLADKIGVEGVQKRTLDAPDEGAKYNERRETAKEMYGVAAPKILAMETTLDLQFDALYSKKQPPLWPNIPLKF